MRVPALTLALLLLAWTVPSQAFMPSNMKQIASSQTVKIVPTRWGKRNVVSLEIMSTTDENVAEKKQAKEDDLFSDPPDLPGQGFENKGPLAWMQMYLDMFGVKEGKSIAYGPIPVNIDESKRPSSDVAEKLRNDATENLQNIGMDERQRRDNAANVMAVVTVVYATWSALFADHGEFGGHVLRFLTVIPLFFAYGYKLSAQTGLCNIAQAGLWDVDGNGLKKIEDPNLARAILAKVNAMNLNTAARCAVPAGIFAVLPQSSAAPLVGSALVLAALYALNGKLPK